GERKFAALFLYAYRGTWYLVLGPSLVRGPSSVLGPWCGTDKDGPRPKYDVLRNLTADAVVAVAVEDDPRRFGRLFPHRPEAVGHLGIERDRVSRPELELLESDLDAEVAANHVGVFVAAVPDERVLRTRLRADVVHDQQKLHFLVGRGREALPSDAVS